MIILLQAVGPLSTVQWSPFTHCPQHRIHPEWQLQVGDFVRLYHEGGGPPPYQVAGIEPGQALILGHPLDKPSNSGAAWGDSWSFVLPPIDQQHTWLIMRMRTPPELSGYMHMVNTVLEPGYFIMFRGMLLGLKQRAEQASRPTLEPGEMGTLH